MEAKLLKTPNKTVHIFNNWDYPYAPVDLKLQSNIDFRIAEKNNMINQLFSDLEKIVHSIDLKMQYKLSLFIIESLCDKNISEFLISGLLEQICSIINISFEKKYIEMVNDIDEKFFSMISRCFECFANSLDCSQVSTLVKTMLYLKLNKCLALMRTTFSARKLSLWVRSNEHLPIPLVIIVDSLVFAPYNILPLKLSAEIARCLIISSIILPYIKDYNILSIASQIQSCINRILKYSPASFYSASAIFCLNLISEKDLIALPMKIIRQYPNHYSLKTSLQLVRMTLNINELSKPLEVLKAASVCEASQSIVIQKHINMFNDYPLLSKYLKRSLCYDDPSVMKQIPGSPSTLSNLALLMRLSDLDPLKFKTITQGLGEVLYNVHSKISLLSHPSIDFKIMIEASKIMSSLMTIDCSSVIGEVIQNCDLITVHYIYITCEIVESIVLSPLFPHKESSFIFPISSFLFNSFLELAQSASCRPYSLFEYLLSTMPNPPRIRFLGEIFVYIYDSIIRKQLPDNMYKQWSLIIISNLKFINAYILRTLKYTCAITSRIVAKTYITFIQLVLLFLPKKDYIYSLLSPLIDLLRSIQIIGKSLSGPIINKISSLFIFFEECTANPVIKTFMNLSMEPENYNCFINILKTSIVSSQSKLCVSILKTLTNMGNYCNSMRNDVLQHQRLVFDISYYQFVNDIINVLMILLKKDYFSKIETSLVSKSIIELFLSWCFPLTYTNYIGKLIPFELMEKLLSSIPPEFIEIYDKVLISIQESHESHDMNNLCELQDLFFKGIRSQDCRMGLFFSLIK